MACSKQDAERPLFEVRFGEKTQCLADAPESLSRFSKGTLPEQGVKDFWACLRRAVDLFVRTTNPRSEVYTPRQIGHFLERFFLRDIQLTDELLIEFMQFKRLVLGGSIEQVTKKELGQTFEILDQLESMTLKLRPHMQLFEQSFDLSQNRSAIPLSQLKEAHDTFDQVTQQLTRLLARQGKDYPLMSFFRLLDELDKILSAPQPKQSRFLPVGEWITHLKGVLFLTDRDLILAREWSDLQFVLSRLMRGWLQYQLGWSTGDWRRGEALSASKNIFTSLSEILDLSLARRNNLGFADQEILDLIESSERLDLFQLDLDANLFRRIFHIVNRRLLRSSLDLKVNPDGRFGRLELKVLNDQFELWHEGQSQFQSARVQDFSEDWRNLLLNTPLQLKLTANLLSDLSIEQSPWSLATLTELNWQRAVLRLLYRGYSREPLLVQDQQRSFEIEPMFEIVQELGPILTELGFFSGLDRAFAQRVMMEGNLFLPRSNGNGVLEFVEAFEYLSYFVSGFRTAQIIRDELKPICPGLDEGWLRRSCYRVQIARQLGHFYQHLPLLVDFFALDSRWRVFQEALESTVGKPNQRDIDFAEILEISVLMQFVETFFLLFDQDPVGSVGFARISAKESLQAFPVYQQVLNDLLGPIFPLPGDDLAIFTFLLANGELPSAGAGLGWEIRFIHWKHHPEQWDFQSTRVEVIRILEALAKERGGTQFFNR